MAYMYPSFLPRVPHTLTDDQDEEAWLREKEEEQQERREAVAKIELYPRPIGVKDSAEQSDTVELGEDEDEEEEEDDGDMEEEEDEEEEEVEGSLGSLNNVSGDYMESDSFIQVIAFRRVDIVYATTREGRYRRIGFTLSSTL